MNPDDALLQIVRWIAEQTRQADAEQTEERLPTAPDIARVLGYRSDYVKKRLKTLKTLDLVHPLGMSPKRYRFNAYGVQFLDTNDATQAEIQTNLNAV